jgi:hypothetical protein
LGTSGRRLAAREVAMTVSDPDTIDLVVSRDSGEIVLVMVEIRDSSSDAGMLQELEKKLDTYVSYSRSSDYEQSHGSKPAVIALVTREQPTDEVRSMLRKLSADTGIPTHIDTEILNTYDQSSKEQFEEFHAKRDRARKTIGDIEKQLDEIDTSVPPTKEEWKEAFRAREEIDRRARGESDSESRFRRLLRWLVRRDGSG